MTTHLDLSGGAVCPGSGKRPEQHAR